MNWRLDFLTRQVSLHGFFYVEREKPLGVGKPHDLHAFQTRQRTRHNVAKTIRAFLTRPINHAKWFQLH